MTYKEAWEDLRSGLERSEAALMEMASDGTKPTEAQARLKAKRKGILIALDKMKTICNSDAKQAWCALMIELYASKTELSRGVADVDSSSQLSGVKIALMRMNELDNIIDKCG